MTRLIRLGNSQGIRTPKSVIQEAQLENRKLTLEVVEKGLLISSNRKPREGWKETIEETLKTQGESLDQEWLEAPLASEEEWGGNEESRTHSNVKKG